MICHYFSEPSYWFFISDVPPLLYYSHIPTAALALLVGLFIFFNGRHLLLNKLLFAICICFFLFTLDNLLLWTNIHSDLLLFSWSFLRVLYAFIPILCIYFVQVFLSGSDVSLRVKGVLLLLAVPLLVFAPTNINVSGFDISECDAFMFQGFVYSPIYIAYAVLAMLWILGLLVTYYRRATGERRKQIALMGIGVEFFLLSFFTTTFLADYLTTAGVFHDSRIEMYGFFGMALFMALIVMLIVRFRTFNVKLIAPQALVVALVILNGSLLLVVKSTLSQIIAFLTLLITTVLGAFLIRSVNREITNREKGEQLARYLANANARLRELDRQKTEFVSIASHQLRAPIAAITGYASLLADGSYGPMPEPIREPLFRIFESGKRIAVMVDDFLNVTRMEQGRMTYATLPVDICKVVRDVTAEIALIADNRGLALEVTLPEHTDTPLVVIGDEGKLKQVLSNLIDNAVKYTKSGFIRVSLATPESKHSVLISITDSGIGIAPEEIPNLFTKFSRATNANDATVTGTGLGLYIAKEIVKAHNGWIHVSSLGVGKGTTFTIEIPLAKVEKAR